MACLVLVTHCKSIFARHESLIVVVLEEVARFSGKGGLESLKILELETWDVHLAVFLKKRYGSSGVRNYQTLHD